jgi:hypothetical protein
VKNADPEDLGARVAEIELGNSMGLYRFANEKAVVDDLNSTYQGYYKPLMKIIDKYFDDKKKAKILSGSRATKRFIAQTHGFVQ